jgi:hypothetical protein
MEEVQPSQPDSSALSTNDVEMLVWALTERATIKATEDALNERKAKVNNVVTMVFSKVGLDKYIGPEGALSMKPGGITKTLNKERLVAKLLAEGLGADRIGKVMEFATDTKPRLGSIEFKARKES